MSTTKQQSTLYIDDYNYSLPDHRIAKYPLDQRDTSKLLVYANGEIREDQFFNLSTYLPENSLLVYNNTRVIQARMMFQKATGAQVEVFCLEPLNPADYALSLSSTAECVWKCMVGNLKKWKSGLLYKSLKFNDKACTLSVELLNSDENTHQIKFKWDNTDITFADLLEEAGELPIPPYLHRKTEASDLQNYQTVYSKIKGSVAAPTAGLHFTERVFESLLPKQIEIAELTLHVGAGTFQPVKSNDVAEHHMHTEVISVHKSTIESLINHPDHVIAVGTTSVRTLESLYYIGNLDLDNIQSIHVSQWMPYENNFTMSVADALQRILLYLEKNNLQTLHADTQIMIKPGYRFRIVKGLITNFHQPKSTLILLISAFVRGDWRKIYDYALTHDFRFLSYGDSSLLMHDVSE